MKLRFWKGLSPRVETFEQHRKWFFLGSSVLNYCSREYFLNHSELDFSSPRAAA